MSKWNVNTSAGLVPASALAALPTSSPNNPNGDGDIEESGTHGQKKVEPLGQGGHNGSNFEIKAFLSEPRIQRRIGCLILLFIVIALIVGLLYPSPPVVYMDRNASLHDLHYTQPADKSELGLLWGNMTMIVESKTVYSVKVDSMQVWGTIGPSGGSLPWNASISDLTLPGMATTTFLLPVSAPIPMDFDYLSIGEQCLLNAGEMTIYVGYDLQVSALGSTFHVSQDLTAEQVPCLD